VCTQRCKQRDEIYKYIFVCVCVSVIDVAEGRNWRGTQAGYKGVIPDGRDSSHGHPQGRRRDGKYLLITTKDKVGVVFS